MLSIPLNQYDSFVKTIATTSLAYQILMSGVFERQTKSDHFERVINILCKDSEATLLLDLANQVYPDLAPDIARNIARAKRVMASTLRQNRELLKQFNARLRNPNSL